MKISAFAASTSRKSINKQLVTYASGLIPDAQVEVLDLNDYALPLFSEDVEAEMGIPNAAREFYDKLGACDALVVSFAEHNGSYTAAYKNLFDWCSRINPKVYQEKPMILLATSPGSRGATSVLTQAENSAPFFAGHVKTTFSLPRFYDTFDADSQRISDDALNAQLVEALSALQA
jgi:chromate reductase, NAD(P)H dehydrogenase (quinone)